MSESTRPPMQTVQRSLLIGALIGIIFGCVVGAGLVGLYIRQNPPVYVGGAYPNELTQNYQDHYLAMVIDSYIVNRQVEVAAERLKTFDDATQIMALGRWSAIYVAGGRAAEAEAVNELAVKLRDTQGWSPETISTVAGQLATEFKDDSAKAQAINTYALALGQVPLEGQPEAEPEQPAQPAPSQPAAAPGGGILRWQTALLCCLGLILILLIALVLYRRLARSRGPAKPEEVWEGEGPPPHKRWTAIYSSTRERFDESENIETEEGALVASVGMLISEIVPEAIIPDSKPQQVTAFDFWVFDKTDITTYNRVILSERAYKDDLNQASIEDNAQAEAILAEQGEEFTIESKAMRVVAKIEDLEFGGEGNAYFDKITVKANIFLKEGIDFDKPMEIPKKFEAYKT